MKKKSYKMGVIVQCAVRYLWKSDQIKKMEIKYCLRASGRASVLNHESN